MAEEKDYIDITYILASSVPNLNRALLSEQELEKAKDTIIHKPLIIVPDANNLPTGHSVENFPRLSAGAKIIGTHISAELITNDKIKHLKTTARVWKDREPEIASTLVALYSVGGLKFSMEAKYLDATLEGQVRKLNGVSFIGSAVVNDPANPFSYALEIAEKEEVEVDEKLVEVQEQTVEELAEEKVCPKCEKPLDECTCEKEEEKAEVVEEPQEEVQEEVAAEEPEEEKCPDCGKPKDECTCEKEKAEIEVLKEALASANETIESLKAEIAQMKQEQADKELAELTEKRFNEMAQYIDFEEDEIASKKEAYAKMDEDTFALILETASKSKKVVKEESNIEFSSDTKLEIKPKLGYLDGLGE